MLRVLQERKVRRIGASVEIGVDTRVIAATNRDLRPMVDSGAFRQDLFYRVSVIPLHVPPLRERPEDIPELAMHFINKFSKRSGKSLTVSPESLDARVPSCPLWSVSDLLADLEDALAPAAVRS